MRTLACPGWYGMAWFGSLSWPGERQTMRYDAMRCNPPWDVRNMRSSGAAGDRYVIDGYNTLDT